MDRKIMSLYNLNKCEWYIKYLEIYNSKGWIVHNSTHWGKTLIDPETGKKYCSGWDSYYLHPNQKIESFAYYFKTEQEAKDELNKYLNNN